MILTVACVGAWRSLVAHLNGVQGVGGSNPLAPTKKEAFDERFGNSSQAASLFKELSTHWQNYDVYCFTTKLFKNLCPVVSL